MPVFNARLYLAEAIGSIQAQTHSDWELIVVDDDSTDGSAELAEELASRDTRIRVVRVPHAGAAPAVNAGAALAHGALLARMDADDVASPNRFTIQLDWMHRNKVDVCGSWVRRCGAGSGLIWFPETHEAIEREMVFRHGLLQPTVLMPTALFNAHRYTEDARFEGNELWIRLLNHARLGNVPAALIKHRCHPEQTHVLQAGGMGELQRMSRRRMLEALFPGTPEAVATALDRVGERQPARDLDELELGGEWLAKLADCPDRLVRQRMFGRWREWCRRSIRLGPGVLGSLLRWEPEFGAAEYGASRRARIIRAAVLSVPKTGART